MAPKNDRYADYENSGRSEYGGGENPQRYPDGSSIPLEDVASSVKKRAHLLRQAGINDFDPLRDDRVGLALSEIDLSKMSFAQREAYEIDLARTELRRQEREELMLKSNDYIAEVEQFEGEAAGAGGTPAPDVR